MVFQWCSVLSPALLYEFTGVTPGDVSNKQARTIIVSKATGVTAPAQPGTVQSQGMGQMLN